MKAGQASNPMLKNTLGRNAWYVSRAYTRMLTAPLFSTGNNWKTECLSIVTSVRRSMLTQWKTEWTTATHNNVGGSALDHQYERGHTVWLHVCEVQNRETQPQWQRYDGRDLLWKRTRGKQQKGWKIFYLNLTNGYTGTHIRKNSPSSSLKICALPTKKVSVAQSCATLCNLTDYTACQAPLSMGFSRQELWLGCHALLQGIFLTQGSNSGLLHWQADSLPSEPQGKSHTLIFTFHE